MGILIIHPFGYKKKQLYQLYHTDHKVDHLIIHKDGYEEGKIVQYHQQ